MAEVRPATPEDFDAVYPLLEGFANAAMSRDDWRRMLFDLPWPVDEPHRGYLLVDRGSPVGFLGTIFSARMVAGRRRRFCNLSSWIVKESHRACSFQLLLPVLPLRTHTIVNLSASDAAHEIFSRLGFHVLEDRQVLIPPLIRPGDLLRGPRSSVETRPEAIRPALDEHGREILDHMRGTCAGQALVSVGDRSCHLVATRSPWKPGLHLAHVQYASDWEMVLDHPALISRAFFRVLRTVGLRLDGRRVRGRLPRFAVQKPLLRPALYRPAEAEVTPEVVDGLYTESVGQRW